MAFKNYPKKRTHFTPNSPISFVQVTKRVIRRRFRVKNSPTMEEGMQKRNKLTNFQAREKKYLIVPWKYVFARM